MIEGAEGRKSRHAEKSAGPPISQIGAWQMPVAASLIRSLAELYQGYQRHTVAATRAINSNSLKRGKVEEILVMNFDGYKPPPSDISRPRKRLMTT